MMISNVKNSTTAFVWIWLPNSTQPVVAGKLVQQGNQYYFMYGKSYLENPAAIPLSPFELSLNSGVYQPEGLNTIHSCIRDAGPDAWGRRLIDYQYPALNANELDYLLLSGRNRIGALDFQQKSKEYVYRSKQSMSLEGVDHFAQIAEEGFVPKDISKQIFMHGTSIGGARPKCLLSYNDKEYIAKFSLSSDHYPLIKLEYIAMKMAKLAGINVAEVQLEKLLNRDVLLIKRFNRHKSPQGMYRKLLLSGLSLLGINEMEARYASYKSLAEVIRQKFVQPKQMLQELYNRLVFNVLVGNTDDHARNHSAFWDGKELSLTPAYDLCPQQRIGQEATQAMAINGEQGNFSTLLNVLSIADKFLLKQDEARMLINQQISVIKKQWPIFCEEVELTQLDQQQLLGSTILSEYCLYGWK